MYCNQYNKMIITIYQTNPGVITNDEISTIIHNN